MQKPSRIVFLSASIMALCACDNTSSHNSSQVPYAQWDQIPTTPAAGALSGNSWQVMSAIASDALEGNMVSLELSDVGYHSPCDPFKPSEPRSRRILGSIPAVTGNHDFTFAAQNLLSLQQRDQDGAYLGLAGEGRVVVDKISDQLIEGRIFFAYKDSEYDAKVSGAFVAKRCRDPYQPEDDFAASTAVDPMVKGHWSGADLFLIDWDWHFAVADSGVAAVQLQSASTSVIEDAEEQWRFDTSTTPKRLMRQVTVSHTSVNGLRTVGDKDFCLYEVAEEAGIRSLKMNCRSDRFPKQLNEPAATTSYTGK